MDHGSCGWLATSGDECDFGVIEKVAEMEDPKVSWRCGFRLGPRVRPMVIDVGADGIDGIVRVESPRLALTCHQQRIEVHCRRGGRRRGRGRRRGHGLLRWRYLGGGFLVLGARRQVGMVGRHLSETCVLMAVQGTVIG